MANITFSPSGVNLLGMTHDDDFEFRVTETPTGSSGSVSFFDFEDGQSEITEVIGAANTFKLDASSVSANASPVSFQSLTPNECTVDEFGHVSKGESSVGGVCTIKATNAYGTRIFSRDMIVNGSSFVAKMTAYKPGTLAAHVKDVIYGIYSGKPDPFLMDLHIHELDRRHWRANRVAPNIDMSWQSVDASDGSAFPCSLISPRHALCAAHAGFFVGRQYVFLKPDGSVVLSTAKRQWNGGSDLGLIYFDQPVTGCANAKLAPNIKTKTSLGRFVGGQPANVHGYAIPALVTFMNDFFIPQELWLGRKLMATELVDTDTWKTPNDPMLVRFSPHFAPGSPYPSKQFARVGDSGSAVFIPVIEPGGTNPVCVLISACHGTHVGPDYSASVAEINSAMNAIKDSDDTTVYAVQLADLSAFTSY